MNTPNVPYPPSPEWRKSFKKRVRKLQHAAFNEWRTAKNPAIKAEAMEDVEGYERILKTL
jgi:hypothetical protein